MDPAISVHLIAQPYDLGRRTIDALLNLFAMKMAGVFMISTCTIGLRTAIFPRWVAFCRLRLCLGAAGGDRQLEVDHAGLPDLDAAG